MYKQLQDFFFISPKSKEFHFLTCRLRRLRIFMTKRKVQWVDLLTCVPVCETGLEHLTIISTMKVPQHREVKTKKLNSSKLRRLKQSCTGPIQHFLSVSDIILFEQRLMLPRILVRYGHSPPQPMRWCVEGKKRPAPKNFPTRFSHGGRT